MPRPKGAITEGEWKGRRVRFRRDRLIVSVRPGSPVDDTLASLVAAVAADLQVSPSLRHRPGRPWAIIEFPAHAQADALIPALANTLEKRPDVRYAEPDVAIVGHLEPNDDKYPSQKAWTRCVDLEGAWDVTKGSGNVLIAVFDSGISISAGTVPDHPDLDGSRFIVQHTLGGSVVKHDYVDDDTVPADENGHGTEMTGIIAATGDNMSGIAGINWVSPVYVARVLDEMGNFPTGTVGDLKQAMHDLLEYAADAGYSRVVANMSLGATTETVALEEMVVEANNGGVLICCAPWPSDGELDYPSAFATRYDHVIAVGAVDTTDTPVSPGTDRIIEPLSIDDYNDITVFAPGVDIVTIAPTYDCKEAGPADPYPTPSGTSAACAIVSGIASLIWSVNPDLTPLQVRDCLRHTAEEFTDDAVKGLRVHAGNAVRGAQWNVDLVDSHLTFVDVADGETAAQTLAFTIDSCTALNFEVVTGSDAGLPAALAITQRTAAYSPGTGTGTLEGIELQYTGVAGDVSFGRFEVRCLETGETWSIYVTANTASTSRTAVVLVADRSGSMSSPSGVDSLSRMEVLQYSSEILVDTMREGDALGVVSFESDAAPVSGMTDIAGDSTTSPERVGLKAAIGTLVPGGSTSIGDGVALGQATVVSAAQDNKALLVLTDGHENTEQWISDVIGSVSSTVYAIGMGTASVIQPAALEMLTTASGGYLVLTETMDDANRYKMAKYMVQMLAAIRGDSMVLDPGGFIRPGMSVDIPFTLCGADRACSVIIMTELAPRLVVELVTPAGDRIDLASRPPGVTVTRGRRVVCCRLSPGGRARGLLPGKWRAVLSIALPEFDHYARAMEDVRGWRPPARGVAYQVAVTAQSDVAMNTRIHGGGHAPGASVMLRVALTDRRRPLHGAAVGVRVAWPDGTVRTQTLPAVAHGIHEGSFVAAQAGVYECLVTARGYTSQGEMFMREQTLTAHAWNELDVDSEKDRAREARRKENAEDRRLS